MCRVRAADTIVAVPEFGAALLASWNNIQDMPEEQRDGLSNSTRPPPALSLMSRTTRRSRSPGKRQEALPT